MPMRPGCLPVSKEGRFSPRFSRGRNIVVAILGEKEGTRADGTYANGSQLLWIGVAEREGMYKGNAEGGGGIKDIIKD